MTGAVRPCWTILAPQGARKEAGEVIVDGLRPSAEPEEERTMMALMCPGSGLAAYVS